MTEKIVCSHLLLFEPAFPGGQVCEECVKTGSRWVHLRTCQECGATLCCNSSPNTHMTKHYHATGHPVVISAEPGEQWVYCYADDAIIRY